MELCVLVSIALIRHHDEENMLGKVFHLGLPVPRVRMHDNYDTEHESSQANMVVEQQLRTHILKHNHEQRDVT